MRAGALLWSLDALTVAALVLAAVLYARGWGWLRRRMPRRFTWLRLLSFMLGLDLLLVAVSPPMEALAVQSLAVHMSQHLLLMMVVAPLLWLAAPLAPLLRGLPGPAMRGAIAVFSWAPVRGAGRVLANPVIGWTSFAVVVWLWHVPAVYERALQSDGWHHLQHTAFIASALLFWWPVVQPWPSRPRWPRWAMIPYLLLADVHNTVLAAIFTFAGRVVYPAYAATAGRAGRSALDDQILAGVIMWGSGSLILLIPAGWLVLTLLLPTGTPRDSGTPEIRPLPDLGL